MGAGEVDWPDISKIIMMMMIVLETRKMMTMMMMIMRRRRRMTTMTYCLSCLTSSLPLRSNLTQSPFGRSTFEKVPQS